MANHRHDRTTGRFISAAGSRVQTLQHLADVPDDEWDLDDEAMAILEAGIALAVEEGWIPPAGWEPEPYIPYGEPDDPDNPYVPDPDPELDPYIPYGDIETLADAWPHALTPEPETPEVVV